MRGAGRRDVFFTALSAVVLMALALPLATTLLRTPPATLALVLGTAEVRRAFGVTFAGALLATLIGLVTGVPLAHLLARRRFPGKALVEGLVQLPVVVPHTAAGVALLMVYGRQGLLGTWLARVGLVLTDSLAGIALAMYFVGAPFLITAARNAFALVESETEQAALTDGASDWQVFLMVTLPAAWRGVASGATMMWARGISEFGAVAILAYHPRTISVLVYEFLEAFGLPVAGAIAASLVLIALAVIVVLQRVLAPREG